MAYFLKKTKNKKGVYLQIYDGFYDPSRGHAVQRSFRPIGYLDDLIEQGFADPLSFFQLEVDQLNLQRNEENDRLKNKLIRDITPERN